MAIGLPIALLMYKLKHEHPELEEKAKAWWYFDYLAFAFCLQRLIFFILRVVLFPIWTILFSCYDLSEQEFDEQDTFDWSIISPLYIKNYPNYFG